VNDIPALPQQVPEITVGTTVTGSEVIDCSVIRAAAGRPSPGEPTRTAAGVWEVGVPADPSPLTDLFDPAEQPRILDDGWITAGAVLARRLGELVAVHPVLAKKHLVQVRVPAETTRRELRRLVTGLCVGGHTLDFSAGDGRRRAVPRAVHVDISETAVDDGAAQKAVSTGVVLGSATACARDVGAVPLSAATPAWWRRTAKSTLADLPGTRAKLHGAGWLQRKGFSGLLSVVTGDAADGDTPVADGEAALVELGWDPDAAEGELTDTAPDTVLIGGAPVLTVVRALAELGAPRKVVGLVPLTGVVGVPPGSRPGRPDEIVRHINGLTTRMNVTGTEARRAEVARRLPLADTVAFGVRRHSPRRVVTVGAVSSATTVALGALTGGIFTGDVDLARRLALCGAKVGERWWPMPLPEHLEASLTAPDADLLISPDGPDAVTAAMYLRRFSGDTEFVHLDTTGPSFSRRVDGERDEGATGFGARTLVEWLRN
jgi:leucyl aminopeptidase